MEKHADSNGTPCEVLWCCALAHKGKKMCAVHLAVAKFKPLDVTVTVDWWAEFAWEFEPVGMPEQLSQEPPQTCEECSGSGDCPHCDGSGTLDCHHFSCRGHDCEECGMSGQCEECNGTGYADRGGKAEPKMHEQTADWWKRRPSEQKAA